MIKKVVIPQIEIKYVCELSEKFVECNCRLDSEGRAFANGLVHKFTRIESPKPLSDDEVRLESVNENNIYARFDNYEIHIISTINCYFVDMTIDANGSKNCSYGCNTLEKIIKHLTLNNCDIYEFSGKNKQQEFFEWALEQLGGKK